MGASSASLWIANKFRQFIRSYLFRFRDAREVIFFLRGPVVARSSPVLIRCRSSSTLRLIALVVGRIVAAVASTTPAFDEYPRVIVVAMITRSTRGNHLHGLLWLLQLLVLARQSLAAVIVPRYRRRCRLIVTPSPLPPSDLRSSG